MMSQRRCRTTQAEMDVEDSGIKDVDVAKGILKLDVVAEVGPNGLQLIAT